MNKHSLHGHLSADDIQTYGSCRPDDMNKYEQYIKVKS